MSGGSSADQAVFGPVPSRRLGLSLGVDLLWPKTCTLDCVYCELGPTTQLTARRGVFRDPDEVLAQVAERLDQLERPPDFITLAGSGEPTLHQDLGRVLQDLKSLGRAKLAVLTNGTLTPDPEVRRALVLADVVVPSLDAVSPDVFARINRPAAGVHPEEIVEGLIALREAVRGRLWLEVLLVAGINDREAELARIIAAAERIGPDRVQLNTVVRPPAVSGVKAVGGRRLAEIAGRFNLDCEVIAEPTVRARPERGELAAEVVEMTRRRPCTIDDLANMAGLDRRRTKELVRRLLKAGRLKTEVHGQQIFYRGV